MLVLLKDEGFNLKNNKIKIGTDRFAPLWEKMIKSIFGNVDVGDFDF
ncbi:hypothetical protein [Mycoplasmopsis phocirhinis]|nr:hypothetical protein [Mycoplasmopsis phocirhinis]